MGLFTSDNASHIPHPLARPAGVFPEHTHHGGVAMRVREKWVHERRDWEWSTQRKWTRFWQLAFSFFWSPFSESSLWAETTLQSKMLYVESSGSCSFYLSLSLLLTNFLPSCSYWNRQPIESYSKFPERSSPSLTRRSFQVSLFEFPAPINVLSLHSNLARLLLRILLQMQMGKSSSVFTRSISLFITESKERIHTETSCSQSRKPWSRLDPDSRLNSKIRLEMVNRSLGTSREIYSTGKLPSLVKMEPKLVSKRERERERRRKQRRGSHFIISLL